MAEDRSSFFNPAYDPRRTTQRSDRVSTNKLTIPATIDQAEFDDRIGELDRNPARKDMSDKFKVFDIRDKLPVIGKIGRAPVMLKTESTKSVHGADGMRHVVPGFTCWDGVPEDKQQDIYDEYAMMGVSDGDAEIEDDSKPLSTLDGKRGFALLVEGMKTYNYMGKQPVYPNDPLMWVHPYDEDGMKQVDKVLSQKSNQSVSYLIPATRENLRYQVSETFACFQTSDFQNLKWKDIVTGNPNLHMKPGQRMALSEYYFLLSGACACFEHAFNQKQVAWVAGKYSQEQVDIALKFMQDSIDGRNPDINVQKTAFEQATRDVNKLASSPVPLGYANFIGFTGDVGPKPEIYNRIFNASLWDKKDVPQNNEYKARMVRVADMAYAFRFHHLASKCRRICAYSGSYGRKGDRIDIIVRNCNIAGSSAR